MYIRSAFILKATVRLPELPLSIIHTCASRAARSGPTCCSPTTSTSRKEELLIQHSCTSPVFHLRIERHTRLKTILRQLFTKMGCNGFTCSKHSLCALNILYIVSMTTAPSIWMKEATTQRCTETERINIHTLRTRDGKRNRIEPCCKRNIR